MNKKVASAIKNHNTWEAKKAFFEARLTQYRNVHNGEKDDCIIIFADNKTGDFHYATNSESGDAMNPIHAVGLLDIVKSSLIQDTYVNDS